MGEERLLSVKSGKGGKGAFFRSEASRIGFVAWLTLTTRGCHTALSQANLFPTIVFQEACVGTKYPKVARREKDVHIGNPTFSNVVGE